MISTKLLNINCTYMTDCLKDNVPKQLYKLDLMMN